MNNNTPPVDAAELHELLAKATPGPWMLDENCIAQEEVGGWCNIAKCGALVKYGPGRNAPGYEQTEANAALIVAAVNALPLFLAALEMQREALEFYADETAWNQPPIKTRAGLLGIEYENQASKVRWDRGRIARLALAQPGDVK